LIERVNIIYKQVIIPIFALVTFSIQMMVQIDMDASTTDFKVDGVINTSCAQNLDDSDWASCKETLETGRYRGILCHTCDFTDNIAQGTPDLCKKEDSLTPIIME